MIYLYKQLTRRVQILHHNGTGDWSGSHLKCPCRTALKVVFQEQTTLISADLHENEITDETLHLIQESDKMEITESLVCNRGHK